MSNELWGIDLGGTKTEGIILSSVNSPQSIIRLRINTESDKGYDHIINQIAGLIEQMKATSGLVPAKIGFGTPGISDPLTKRMKNCNTTSLNGKFFQKDLEEKLGVPVVIANDANCFALAETTLGAVREKAPGAKMVFGIIMGTGVGGGVVIDGKVWNGHHGIGGEWGHNFLDESGGHCYCGKTGCVETVISGPATEKFYESISGKKISLKQIVENHRAKNDPAATRTIERLTYFFGRAISVITNILDPDVIVVGGGVGNIDELYSEGIASLQKNIFNDAVHTLILKPSLGDSAGVFGAAALVAS
ncbi:MAG: ROK family protein [Bacteroidetes bacterium]|nr:ROK family protein [Bacteroidota bacterium]